MTRSPERDERAKDERRDSILHHALVLFASKGLHATRIADIAAAAGMSQGLLYHYFRSKEEVFTEIVRSAFEKMNSAALGLEAASMPPAEKIHAAMAQLVSGIEEGDDFANTVLLNAQAGMSPDTPAEALAIIREESMVPYGVVERILRAGQVDGSVRQHDPKELAMLFWTTVKGLALHRAVYGAEFKAPDVGILMSMFLVDSRSE